MLFRGANGLNVIEANHVVLVEPMLSDAVEQQAISRVHRIGQTRPTFVHRYLVRDTVEGSIHDVAQRHTRLTTRHDISQVYKTGDFTLFSALSCSRRRQIKALNLSTTFNTDQEYATLTPNDMLELVNAPSSVHGDYWAAEVVFRGRPPTRDSVARTLSVGRCWASRL